MALREISGNVRTDNCENIAELKKYRRELGKNLKEVELRIQQRLGRLSGDASFSSDNTVNEVSLLEEDKFWKLEIQKKIQESDDELVARGLIEKCKWILLERAQRHLRPNVTQITHCKFMKRNEHLNWQHEGTSIRMRRAKG